MYKRRRLLLLLSLVLLPLLVLEVTMQLAQRRNRETELHQEALRLLDAVGAEQQRLIDGVQQILGTMAVTAAAQIEAAGCQPMFEAIRAQIPRHLVIQAADLQGVVRCSTNPLALGAFIGDRENVRQAIATGGFAVGGYSVARGIGNTILTFGMPYNGVDGQRAGVLTALLDIAWLEDYLARKPLPEGAAILMADRTGTVVVRTPALPNSIGRPLPEQLRPMLHAARPQTLETHGLDGVYRIFAYSPVDARVRGVMVAVALDKSAAMRPVDSAMYRSLAIFGGVLVFCYIGAAWGIRRLVRLQEGLLLALKSGNAGTFELDVQTGKVPWSEESFRIFGLDPARHRPSFELWKSILHPDDRDAVLRTRQETFQARRTDHRLEYRIRCPDGTERWVETIGKVTYGSDGLPRRLVGLHIDVTQRKETAAALRTARDEAERANLAKTKFLAAASHDLRQPVQSMFLFAAALRPHVGDERGRSALDMIERELDALKGLLDNLLDVSRLDAAAVKPTIEDFNIRMLLDHIGASYAPVAANKGLELKVDRTCDAMVRSDRALLGRILRNLVENAIRYTEQGSVRLECHVANGHVRIEVHDTGIGIPPDQMDHIFEEFHQVGSAGHDRGQGLGLGLSIVQRLSKLLGHQLTVRSELGSGSVFAVDVAVVQIQDAPQNELNQAIARGG